MKNTLRHFMTALVAASAAIAVASCEKVSSPDDNLADGEWSIAIEGIECATKAAPTVMHRNENAVLKATILRNGEPYDYDGEWEWTSSNGDVVFVSGADRYAYLHASNCGDMKWEVKATTLSDALGRDIITDGPISVPSKLTIHVTEATYYDQIVTTLDFDTGGEEWTGSLGMVFVYNAYNGTPTHYAAEHAGQAYYPYLSNFALTSKNTTLMKRDITGPQRIEMVSPATEDYCFYKRLTTSTIQNTTGFDEIEYVYDKDYTFETDDFLYAIPRGGANANTHKPQYLGTYYFIFTDYVWLPNSNNSGNFDQTAELCFRGLELADGTFSSNTYPTGKSIKIDVRHLFGGGSTTLETWPVEVLGKMTPLRSINTGNHGNGFTFADMGTNYVYFAVQEDQRIYESNGDYYLLKFGLGLGQ